jgi:hypothetical protein
VDKTLTHQHRMKFSKDLKTVKKKGKKHKIHEAQNYHSDAMAVSFLQFERCMYHYSTIT